MVITQACDQCFFLELSPLYAAYTKLYTHAKNSIFMNNPKSHSRSHILGTDAISEVDCDIHASIT